MKQFTRLAAGLALVSLIFSSCKKEKEEGGRPEEGTPVLEIRLDTAYVASSDIDSLVLLWEVGGQTQQRVLVPQSNIIRFAARDLVAGNGRMTIQLYTQVRHRGGKLQFEKRGPVEVSNRQTIVTAGPKTYSDPDWAPRVIIEEKEWTNLVVLIALRPEDPYFSIRNIPARWPHLGISRSYYRKLGGLLLAEKIWMADGSGQSNIEDRTHFLGLEEQLAGKDWGWIDVNFDAYNIKENPVGFSMGFYCPR